jgi:hypothetical protein
MSRFSFIYVIIAYFQLLCYEARVSNLEMEFKNTLRMLLVQLILYYNSTTILRR